MELFKDLKSEKIKAIIVSECEKNDWQPVDVNEIFSEWIDELPALESETICSHRWYDSVSKVVDLNGTLVMFNTFHTTGDAHWSDMGLDYSFDSLVEVEEYTKEVKAYRVV